MTPSPRATPRRGRAFGRLRSIVVLAGLVTALGLTIALVSQVVRPMTIAGEAVSAAAGAEGLIAAAAVPPGRGDAGTAAGVKRILIPIGGLIILAVIGGVAVMLARRNMLVKDAAADQGGLLDDLRKMRDTGQISVEEFDAARKSIAAKLAGRPAAAPERTPLKRQNQPRTGPQ